MSEALPAFFYTDIWVMSESNLICLSQIWVKKETKKACIYDISHFVTKVRRCSESNLICLSQIWVKSGPKMPIFGPKWPKMKILDQIWPFLGQNSWFQREEAKGLVPTQRKTTYAPCLHRFLAGHETKWAKNADIWPKISVLGKIWLFMGQNFI